MFNFQISIVSTIVSTFNFRRPAARESGNSQFSRKLAKLEKLAKLAIFRPVSFFGNQSKMDQKLRVLPVFSVLRVLRKLPVSGFSGCRPAEIECQNDWFLFWKLNMSRNSQIWNREWMRKSVILKGGVVFSWLHTDSLLENQLFIMKTLKNHHKTGTRNRAPCSFKTNEVWNCTDTQICCSAITKSCPEGDL